MKGATVGELKAFLANVPDHFTVEAYEGEDNCVTIRRPGSGVEVGYFSFDGQGSELDADVRVST
jgi:hypothetical protein